MGFEIELVVVSRFADFNTPSMYQKEDFLFTSYMAHVSIHVNSFSISIVITWMLLAEYSSRVVHNSSSDSPSNCDITAFSVMASFFEMSSCSYCRSAYGSNKLFHVISLVIEDKKGDIPISRFPHSGTEVIPDELLLLLSRPPHAVERKILESPKDGLVLCRQAPHLHSLCFVCLHKSAWPALWGIFSWHFRAKRTTYIWLYLRDR